ncbi:MAG: hypothetical protein P1U68_09310 [Verrucomicrobiales bacterium]|nr:hypothetical protein [Verrucomicrobiales bacterium]
MNRDKARFILSSVRQERVDRNDPQVEAAMQLLADDPELQDWFEKSQQFDEVISERLAEVSPPPGLRDSILTGMEVSQSPPWERRALVSLLLAAVLTLGGFVSWMISSKNLNPTGERVATLGEFEQAMEETISELEGLDVLSSDPLELLQWLSEKSTGTVPQLSVAEELSTDRFVGCKVVKWRGHEVSLICMRQGKGRDEMPDLHLFTISADAIEGLVSDELIARSPETDDSTRKWSTAAWRSGGRVYLILAAGKHVEPRELLPFG